MGKAITADRKRSIWKGALAGLAGGIAGSGAKMLAEKAYPPRLPGEQAPPLALVERAAGRPLNAGERETSMHAIHWTLRALAGAVYGAMVEMRPQAKAWGGVAFGLTVNKLTHRRILPKMGLEEPLPQQPMQKRQSEWVTHAVYGVVTEAVRRGVRSGLD